MAAGSQAQPRSTGVPLPVAAHTCPTAPRDAQSGRDRALPAARRPQGALEEAQLISWPAPGKAFLDTLLVLGIVTGTGMLLFGLNVLLADVSQWFYSQH